MVTASILGLPAVALVLMSMSCINLGSEPESAKNKRSVLGGTIILLTGKLVFVLVKAHITLRNKCNNIPLVWHLVICRDVC